MCFLPNAWRTLSMVRVENEKGLNRPVWHWASILLLMMSSYAVLGVAPAANSNAANDWCAGHEVPESACTICNPELIPQYKAAGDWCAPHNLPESVCPKCNHGPAPSQAHAADWCAGHGVPESACTICNPELIPQFKAAGDWCAEHELPESVCPMCNPLQAQDVPIEQRIVRFVSPEKEAEVGIETVAIHQEINTKEVIVPAQVAFDENRMADLRTVVHGVVHTIYASVGDQITPGQPLFDLTSPRVGEVQAHLRTARAKERVAKINLKRQQSLAEKQIASAWELEQAEVELEAAQAEVGEALTTLRAAGAREDGEPGRLTILAPIGGTLVRRDAVLGTLATDETSLGLIVDTSQMWVLSDIPERDIAQVSLGDHVDFVSDGGVEAHGDIEWIAAAVDGTTRTVTVRIKVANPEGKLRAHQFGRATIAPHEGSAAWVVPSRAIQRVEGQEVVFVKRDQGVYLPKVVTRLGAGDWTPVAGNLLPGDRVVTTGAVLLRTEMLPGSIGAGCCEVEPLGVADGGH